MKRSSSPYCSVIEVLEASQLWLNKEECEFGKQLLVYLEFIIGVGELKMDPKKISVIYQWSATYSVTKVRSMYANIWEILLDISLKLQHHYILLQSQVKNMNDIRIMRNLSSCWNERLPRPLF